MQPLGKKEGDVLGDRRGRERRFVPDEASLVAHEAALDGRLEQRTHEERIAVRLLPNEVRQWLDALDGCALSIGEDGGDRLALQRRYGDARDLRAGCLERGEKALGAAARGDLVVARG